MNNSTADGLRELAAVNEGKSPSGRTRSRRWKVMLAGLLFAAVVSVVVWEVSAPYEPSYNGRKLSVWLDEIRTLDYMKRADPATPQVQAVRAMGTNAIPWLLHQFRPSSSSWHWRANQQPNRQKIIKFRFPDINMRLQRAATGFCALAELGESAIPALLERVEVYPGYVPGALAGIGRPAIPALHQCLANTRLYTNSAGIYAIAPGNTISEIFNATSLGPFDKSDTTVFLPTITNWVQQTTNQQAKSKAQWFLDHYDQLR